MDPCFYWGHFSIEENSNGGFEEIICLLDAYDVHAEVVVPEWPPNVDVSIRDNGIFDGRDVEGVDSTPNRVEASQMTAEAENTVAFYDALEKKRSDCPMLMMAFPSGVINGRRNREQISFPCWILC